MRARPVMSVRSLLLTVTITLGAFSIGTCGVNLKNSWDAGATADLVSRLSKVDDALLQALQSMRQERGDTAAILNLASEDVGSRRSALAGARAKVDEAFASAEAGMSDLPGGEAARSARSLTEALRGFRALRNDVDAALNLSPESRDKAMSGRVLRSGDTVLGALNEATAGIDGWIKSLDQDSGALVSVKQLAWLTRAASGNSVVPIQTALAARTGLGASDLQNLDQTAGRVAANWQLVLDGSKPLSGSPRLTAAIDTVRDGFFGPAFTSEMQGLRRSLAANEAVSTTMADFQKEATARTLEITQVATTAMALTLEKALEKSAAARSSFLIDLAVLCGSLVLVGIGLWVANYRVARPIRDLTAAMKLLAGGNLSVPVPVLDRSDEFGAMAGAVQVFKDNAAALQTHQAAVDALHRDNEIRLRDLEQSFVEAGAAQTAVVDAMASGLAKLSQGDLMFRLKARLAPEYEVLKADFNAAVSKLQDTMRSVASSTSAIRSGSGEISSASNDLSRRTEQQAASLEETAAALDEITATVRKTAEGARYVRDVVGRTKSDAEHSSEVVGRAVRAMSGIESSSRQVSQIIGVIDEIAFQTNLLALNAGVEAARAGEAGRGFAVVASEVRALAQRSAEAAREIKTLISTASTQVDEGVSLVGETGQALERITSRIAEINGIVAEIAASAQEQASGLDQINTAVNQMDQVTQQNAAMVEESTAASHALSQETSELARLMGEFRLSETAEATRPVAPAPIARSASRSAPKPVLALRTTGRGGAARALDPAADDGWTEF